MRLRALHLLRYGHLSDVVLEFPASAALHVVLGANETGKSTALAAIGDALFGFGKNTDYAFLHQPNQLRVGFTLTDRDGDTAHFVRSKRNKNALEDAAGQPVSELALRRFLGGADHALFKNGFGLHGKALRENGEKLARGGGDAGEAVIASFGFREQRATLARLEAEEGNLAGDRRGKRRLNEAREAYLAAERDREAASIKPAAWKQLRHEIGNTEAALTGAEAQARALREELNRLGRIRLVAGRLARLAEQRELATSLADAPRLPSETAARHDAALAARRDAARDIARENAELERLAGALAQLSPDPAVLAEQEAVDALAESRAVIVDHSVKLAADRRKAMSSRDAIADAVRDLGRDLAPEAVVSAMVGAPARRLVRRLIGEHAKATTALDAAAKAVRNAMRRHETLAVALAATAAPEDPGTLRRTIDQVRDEGGLDRQRATASHRLATAAAATATALAAVPLWHGDAAALAALPVPPPTAIRLGAQLASTTGAVRRDAEGAAAAKARNIVEREAEIAAIARGDAMPTASAIGEARALREQAWRGLRRLLEGPLPATETVAGLVDAFEARRDAADRLADRRADEAQRLEAYRIAAAELARLREAQPSLEEAALAARVAAEEAAADWIALWSPCGILPLAPDAMREWSTQRDAALGLAAVEATRREERDDAEARWRAAQAALAAVLPTHAGPGRTLAAALAHAGTACAAAEAAVAAYAAKRLEVEQAAAALPALLDEERDARTELRKWAEAWQPAVEALGLPGDAAIEKTEAALDAWERIAVAAPAWREASERVGAMEAGVADFESLLAVTLGRLGEARPSEPATVTAARLEHRLRSALETEDDIARLELRIEETEGKMREAAASVQDAEAILAELRAAAAVADDSALAGAIVQAGARDQAEISIAELASSILQDGGGRDEAELRREVASVDPDTAAARIEEIGSEQETIAAAQRRLSGQLALDREKLAQMEQGGDAIGHAQRAANALADARDAAERYARVHVARVLLAAGIERFRREQQGPLLRAAASHFRRLTRGRYERLEVDEDDKGKHILLAVSHDDTRCPMDRLSEGTSDQLYLALRLAAIEAHAAGAEPLPFVADDLLVHFDDERAAATLAALAAFGRNSQVILFTHHEHIADLARQIPRADVQVMPARAAGLVLATD